MVKKLIPAVVALLGILCLGGLMWYEHTTFEEKIFKSVLAKYPEARNLDHLLGSNMYYSCPRDRSMVTFNVANDDGGYRVYVCVKGDEVTDADEKSKRPPLQ